MKSIAPVLILLILAVVAPIQLAAEEPEGCSRETRPSLAAGSQAPDFAFTDLDGKARRLSDFRGKVVLLDFWATYCRVCVEDTPKIAALHREFRDRGFEVIGISQDETTSVVREFTARREIAWPQAVEGNDPKLAQLFRVPATPTYLLIGRDGTILARNGEIQADDKALERLLEKHLAR